ncbi:MAG: hypothetical protein H6713_27150 [Myxococcales bacterium]|nr:hypothetical protein [Myxococcales bacterium]
MISSRRPLARARGLAALAGALLLVGCVHARARSPTCPRGEVTTGVYTRAGALARAGLPRTASFGELAPDGRLAVVARQRASARGQRARVVLDIVDTRRGRVVARRRLPRGPSRERWVALAEGGAWFVHPAGGGGRIERTTDGAREATLAGLAHALATSESRLLWIDDAGRLRLWARDDAGRWREEARDEGGAGIGPMFYGANALVGDGALALVRVGGPAEGPWEYALLERRGAALTRRPETLRAGALARVDARRVASVVDGRYCEWTWREGQLEGPRCGGAAPRDPWTRLAVGDDAWIYQHASAVLGVMDREGDAPLELRGLPRCVVIHDVDVVEGRALVITGPTRLRH